MPKMIVSIDEVVIKEVQLTKDKTTLGRRPYNDIVIDNLAVSGEHAVILMTGGEVVIEDLNSTNGTYVNGRAVKKQLLQHGDGIEVGKYKIKFLADNAVESASEPSAAKVRPTGPTAESTGFGDSGLMGMESPAARPASIRVLSGAAAGREVPLTKVVTTVGRPAVAVAAITKRQHGYVVHHVEGGGNPTLNGAPVSADPIPLRNGDVLELAGTRIQFVQMA